MKTLIQRKPKIALKLLSLLVIGSLYLSSCHTENKKIEHQNTSTTIYIPMDSAHAGLDSATQTHILPYKNHVDSIMNVELGFSDREYFKKKPNGLLNNLAADMVLEMTRKNMEGLDYSPDFCLLNYGGLRHPLPKGIITLSDVYQLMPFQNEVVILELKGGKIDSLFNYIAFTGGQPIAGCRLRINNHQYLSATINGKKFDKTKSYFLVTSDYLANGGDHMSFLQNPIASYKTGLLLRNAMINYIKAETAKGNKIIASNEERIKTIDHE